MPPFPVGSCWFLLVPVGSCSWLGNHHTARLRIVFLFLAFFLSTLTLIRRIADTTLTHRGVPPLAK